MVHGPAPHTIIWSLQNGDCSEKGGRFCAGWWRLLSESLLELLRDEAAGAGIISWRMPNCLSAELLPNKGREKLYVAPIVFLSNRKAGGCAAVQGRERSCATRTARQSSSSFELICLLPAAIPAAPPYNRVIFRTPCVSSPTNK
jgi:hypothetical protein